MLGLPLEIAGMGYYLPERVVTNRELEVRCHLPQGWIERHNGVRERRWAEGETASWMGAQAATSALAQAGIAPGDLDLIINASGTPEQTLPDGGALIQRALGLGDSGITTFSVHATCLSFVVALHVAASLLQTRLYRTILVVSSEVASKGANFDQPASATLLGDAAAAAVLTLPPSGAASEVQALRFATYGDGADATAVFGGGSRRHPNDPTTCPEDNLFTMNGQHILKLVRRTLPGFLEALRPTLSTELGTISLVVPHQASKVGLRVLHHCGYPAERIAVTLDRFGNCVAASIPLTLALAIEQGRVERGDEVLLLGSGAGLSLGGIILVY